VRPWPTPTWNRPPPASPRRPPRSSRCDAHELQINALVKALAESHTQFKDPIVKRPVAKPIDGVESARASSSGVNSAQGPGEGARDLGQPGCDLFPAPASTGTNVPLSYFGPPPSSVNQSLVGPVLLLNTGQVDSIHGTIAIPLYTSQFHSIRDQSRAPARQPGTSSPMFPIRGLLMSSVSTFP
jgi:hypothetical protein